MGKTVGARARDPAANQAAPGDSAELGRAGQGRKQLIPETLQTLLCGWGAMAAHRSAGRCRPGDGDKGTRAAVLVEPGISASH